MKLVKKDNLITIGIIISIILIAVSLLYIHNREYRCTRTKRYNNAPEFDRALSLYKQRMFTNNEYALDKYDYGDITNCVIVKYADLNEDEAEGVFIFGDKNSNHNRLVIYVDNGYKEDSDLMTTMLLAHEIEHAKQYLDILNRRDNLSCLDKEVRAFTMQAIFTMSLNQGEEQSLFLLDIADDDHPQIQWLKELDDYYRFSVHYCGDDIECQGKTFLGLIKINVYDNPGYQKQCSSQLK